MYDKIIFELSKKDCVGYSLPKTTIPDYSIASKYIRNDSLNAPSVSELDVVRHYTNLSLKNYGVDQGFYPLGSCTMKYNPKINEEMSKIKELNIHPLQSEESSQGCMKIYYELEQMLCKITGMSAFTLNPFAGAHGELTGLMIIRQYHLSRGDFKRTRIIVPTSAHGTNPASSNVCGLEVVLVNCLEDGTVNVEELKTLVDDSIAGIMLTNPNTVGIFENRISEIAKIIHDCGGLMYYDGANLNAILGVAKPQKMGFDVMHINLHKTFSTPHGGGGPGSGPVGVIDSLVSFLPNPRIIYKDDKYRFINSELSIGRISSFYGNFSVIIKAYCYILSLGNENISYVAKLAVLNANYIKESLKDVYKLPIKGICKHEVVFDGLINEKVTTLDVAKRLLDYGYHPPTIYFPLLFHQALMIEPTECESKETLDCFIEIMKKIAFEAMENPELLISAPHNTVVRRLDEVKAARNPIVRYLG